MACYITIKKCLYISITTKIIVSLIACSIGINFEISAGLVKNIKNWLLIFFLVLLIDICGICALSFGGRTIILRLFSVLSFTQAIFLTFVAYMVAAEMSAKIYLALTVLGFLINAFQSIFNGFCAMFIII